jgi:hypothetical protein
MCDDCDDTEVVAVGLRRAAAEGRLVETSDGTYKVKDATTGHLKPLEDFLNMEMGSDFFKCARKTCKPLQWHPSETRVVEHENLWPRRKLRVLFFAGSEVWTRAQVKSWTEVTVQNDKEISDEVEWNLKIDFDGEVPMAKTELQPGALVQIYGLESATGQSNNGRLAVVSKPLTKASPGRLPVMYSEESSGELKFLLIKPDNLKLAKAMEFKVAQINVQGGGMLIPFPDTISGNMRLSFEWLERVSEEPPWYFVPDSPDAKWREPFVENEVEVLQAVYKTKLEQCLAQNDRMGIENICKDVTCSIGMFTEFGSK